MMKVSSKKAICLFCFMFIAELGASLNCTGSCGNRGLHIRFPFWIKDRQPEQCGYPGFDLSCNEMGDIVLELQGAVKLYIDKIDYKNQVIYASDPQGCLRSHHSNFNSSVFHMQFKMSKVNFTIFNCSLNNARYLPRVACLSTLYYDVLAVDSEQSIDDNELLLSCTKMYDIPVPHDIRLSWSNPNCGSCEATGKVCGLRENSSTELETECYGLPRPEKAFLILQIEDTIMTLETFRKLELNKGSYLLQSTKSIPSENQKKNIRPRLKGFWMITEL
ncbi:hypothetical protein H0E87_013932 [Populus deltoides]|uniref:RING-type E3 ubiquitin transferase n=1 Tax=Populus deltoides TaxID=3696 RepID=A0A8T2YB75_POPDE|nr:hypothetical protein H0E87_013932 [Populus deltoides]